MSPVQGVQARAFIDYLKQSNLLIKDYNYYKLICDYKSFTDFVLFCINENKINVVNLPYNYQTNYKLLIKLGLKQPSLFLQIKRMLPNVYNILIVLIAEDGSIADVPYLVKKDIQKLPATATANDKTIINK